MNRYVKRAEPVALSAVETFSSSHRENQFGLFSVILHIGISPRGGHYVTVSKPSDNADQSASEWYLLNDDHAPQPIGTELNKAVAYVQQRFQGALPYVLWYRRIDNIQSITPNNHSSTMVSKQLQTSTTLVPPNHSSTMVSEQLQTSTTTTTTTTSSTSMSTVTSTNKKQAEPRTPVKKKPLSTKQTLAQKTPAKKTPAKRATVKKIAPPIAATTTETSRDYDYEDVAE